MAKMTVDELQVLITANAKQLETELAKVNVRLAGLGTKTDKAWRQVGLGAITAGNLIAQGIGRAMQGVSSQIGSAIERLDTINNYPRVMSNLGISAEDSEKSIKRLSDGLLGLPTALQDGVSAVQRFTSANQNIGASTEMFLALNNAILAGGASMVSQSSALEQLSQAYAKGKPDMMEWRTAMTAMPAQLMQVAKAMGFANAQKLGEALTTGKVNMQDFMNMIARMNKEGVAGFKSFDEQARNATGGIGTSIANLKNAIDRALADIMNAIGQENISAFFQGLSRIIGQVARNIIYFGRIIGAVINSIVKAVGAVSNFFRIGAASKATEASTAKTAGNMSSTAKSVGAVASGLGDANKEAKALSKQLAGFDEMNVLTPPSGGTSSASGVNGLDLSNIGDIDTSGIDNLIGSVPQLTALENTISGIATGLLGVALAGAGVKLLRPLFARVATAIGLVSLGMAGAAGATGLFAKTFTGIGRLLAGFAPLAAGAVAGVAGLTFVIGGLVSAFNQTDEATRKAEANRSAMQKAQDNLKLSTDALKQAEISLNDARLARTNADIAYTQAIKDQEQAIKTLTEAQTATGISFDDLKAKVDAGRLSYQYMTEEQRQVYDAGLALEGANANLAVSSERLTEATNAETEAYKEKRQQLIENQKNALIEEAVQKTLAGEYNNVEDAVNDLKDKYAEYTDENGKKSKLNAEEVADMESRISSSMGEVKKAYRDTMSGADQGFFGPMGVSLSKVGGWIGQFVSESAKKIGEWAKDFGKKAGEVKDALTSKLGNLWGDAKSWAGSIMDGLKSGLDSGINKVKETAGKVASSISGFFKNVLGIHSPSTVFRDFGLNIDEGLAQGIDKGIAGVLRSMDNLVDATGMSLNIPATLNASSLPTRNDSWSGEIADLVKSDDVKTIVVQIGEEQIIRKVIDLTNERTDMSGMNTIRV